MRSIFQKILRFLNLFINVKMGLAGAFVMGVVVWFINMDHGWFLATTAALKQAAYTFLFGGVLIKILDTIVMMIKNRYLAISVATVAVSGLTIFLIFLVHSAKGTPETYYSTMATVIMAPPGFLFLAIRNRRKE